MDNQYLLNDTSPPASIVDLNADSDKTRPWLFPGMMVQLLREHIWLTMDVQQSSIESQ